MILLSDDGLTKWKRYSWTLNGRKRIKEANRRAAQRLKELIITHYSEGLNRCARCGIADMRVLTIDHINGNGAKQKRDEGIRKGGFYWWLKRNGYPPSFQVLCFNCQVIKRIENHEVVPSGNYLRPVLPRPFGREG